MRSIVKMPNWIWCGMAGLFVLLSGAQVLAAERQVLESGTYRSGRDARAVWAAQANTPPVKADANRTAGLEFPCPFSRGTDRFFWDRTMKVDLSGYRSLELDISCEQPAALRSLSIYLKSGNGWYVWNGPLLHPGRQTLSLSRADFKADGRPAGWNQIERVRISPWKGDGVDTSLTLHALEACNNRLVLVQGTLSAPDAGEKNAAKRSCRRISRWLQDSSVPHDVITEEELLQKGLAYAQLVMLCYNPQPPASIRNRLFRFIEQGGRLVVFYSADAELATRMHMKLGAYQSAERYGQWSSFVFEDAAHWNVPVRVFQESWNIRPVYPADKTAETIAWWQDLEGNATKQPAWVAGEQGAWMSHILLDDDAQGKRAMLLGIIGHYLPQIWARVAWQCIHRAGRVDSCRSMGDALNTISAQAAKNGTSRQTIAAKLRQSRQLFSMMLDAYEHEQYPKAVRDYRALRASLTEAYARAQVPQWEELRGVWDHHALGLYPGDWARTCRELKKAGLSDIFSNVGWPSKAHYESDLVAASESLKRHGDQLAQCVQAAYQAGLKAHAWLICWNMQGASPEQMKQLRQQGRLLVGADGVAGNWLNPAHPENRRMQLNIIREIARNYRVDGIHLDYIRYPDSRSGFGATSRRVFEAQTGVKVRNWPKDVQSGGAQTAAFQQWRARQISSFVAEARAVIQQENIRIKLSAAVYGSYPECKQTVGQDWGEWLRTDSVDFVCPMDYTASGMEFRRLVSGQMALPNAAGRIIPGIGVTSTESQLTADLVVEQILITRESNCGGFVLFDLDPTLRDRILPLLSMGVTRE